MMMIGRSQNAAMLFLPYMQSIPAIYPHNLPYNANAIINPPTIASPPVATFPAAALEDVDEALLDVDEELPLDVLVALVLALVRVVERVPFELVCGATVAVEVTFALADFDTTVALVEGAEEV